MLTKDLLETIEEVLKKECWYYMRIVPYFKTVDVDLNMILIRVDIGVVCSFVICLAELTDRSIHYAPTGISPTRPKRLHLFPINQGELLDKLDYGRGSQETFDKRVSTTISKHIALTSQVRNDPNGLTLHSIYSDKDSESHEKWFEEYMQTVVSLMAPGTLAPCYPKLMWYWETHPTSVYQVKTFWPINTTEKTKLIRELSKLIPKP